MLPGPRPRTWATEAAIAALITGGGEALVSGTSEGVGQAAAGFRPPPVPLRPAACRLAGGVA